MKRFHGAFFKCYMVMLAGLLAWCVLTSSAQPTNTDTTTVQVKSDRPVEAITTVVKTESPSLTFGLHRIPELQAKLMGIPLWQYLASAIYVALAFLAARIINYLVTVQLRKLFERAKWSFGEMIIQLLHGPIKVLALVIMLQFGLNLFQWPEWLEAWLRKGFYVLLACSITYMVLKLVDVVAMYWRERPMVKADNNFNDLLIPLMSKTVKGFILIMAVLVTLDNLNFNIRTLLAGVSISGLALGLAAQDTVGNLFGAAAVFIDKPFKIGDRIQTNGIDGVVEEIGLRSTRVRNLDGHWITVPNKTMGNSTITNITRRPNIKTTMNIGITYDTRADRVQEALNILNEIYKGHPKTHDIIVGFNTFADSSLNILVVHWWKGLDFKEYLAGMESINLAIKQRFDEAGIGFAFPSRTVYLRQDNDWRVQLPVMEEKKAVG